MHILGFACIIFSMIMPPTAFYTVGISERISRHIEQIAIAMQTYYLHASTKKSNREVSRLYQIALLQPEM